MKICEKSAEVLEITLKTCILLMFCQILLRIFGPPLTEESYYFYQYIEKYNEVCLATLLIGSVGALWLESISRKKQ